MNMNITHFSKTFGICHEYHTNPKNDQSLCLNVYYHIYCSHGGHHDQKHGWIENEFIKICYKKTIDSGVDWILV